jgi:DNA (cytosine-5)-methyltransferase 1
MNIETKTCDICNGTYPIDKHNFEECYSLDYKWDLKQMEYKFIDLFCGIGGFHIALSQLGFECVLACDINKECIKTYECNYNLKPCIDISKINIKTIPHFDILCAGFPCQPFSKSGDRKGFDDVRGTLFFNICEIAKYHNPKYMILENVKNIVGHDKGNTWDKIKKSIIKLGYQTYEHPIIINSLMFNIPQNRERAIILCCRNGIHQYPFPILPKIKKKELKCSVTQIINSNEDNSEYKIYGKIKATETIWNKFLKILCDNNIRILQCPIWTDWWDSDGKDTSNFNSKSFYEKYKKWIDRNRIFWNTNKNILNPWLVESRNNPLWIGAVRKFEWQVGSFGGSESLFKYLWSPRSSGIRVKKLNYSPTIVAISNTPIYGPESRYLTPRELCRLQSFPENFILHPKNNVAYRQLGNSVNVTCIKKSVEYMLYGTPYN